MTQYFEIVARVPLTGDAMANASTVFGLAQDIDAFRQAIIKAGGTVDTRTAKTKAPNNTAKLPTIQQAAE